MNANAFSTYKESVLSALILSIDNEKNAATVSIDETKRNNLETNFSKLSDDEKEIIRKAVSSTVKERINVSLAKQYKDDPLLAVSHCFTTYSIPEPFGTGKQQTFTLSCRQFLSPESQKEYDNIALSLNRLFAYMVGKDEKQKTLARKDIKFFVTRAFTLFTSNNIRCNEKDLDLFIQSSISIRSGKSTTYREPQLQLKIEFVLHNKCNNTDYLVELLSKNKDFNRIVPEAVEFVADKKEQPKAETSK